MKELRIGTVIKGNVTKRNAIITDIRIDMELVPGEAWVYFKMTDDPTEEEHMMLLKDMVENIKENLLEIAG